MESPDRRRVSYEDLHPVIRDTVRKVIDQLNQENHPFELFEAYRTPARQRHLFAQGRTRKGDIVTKAKAWQSFHQYGLAVDIVLKVNGDWSWQDTGKFANSWQRLHEIGRKHGLEPLSFERPHLQWADGELRDLQAGRYPPGGDRSWAENLEAAIASWSGQGEAPPPPADITERPPLPPDALGSELGGSLSTSTGGVPFMSAPGDFERAHGLIKEFEGGFVNDPRDPGGATNFGITIDTLSAVRGRPVSVQEVRNLTFAEAKGIFFDLYWSRMNCGQLPGPLALAVYNIGVHCGVKTAGTYLQRALNTNGAAVEVDGWIGDETIGAVKRADLRPVLEETIDLYETRLRGHPNFAHFEKGFMRRVNLLRQETGRWLAEIIATPTQPAPSPSRGAPMPFPHQQQPLDLFEALKKIQEVISGLQKPAAPAPGPAVPTEDLQRSIAILLALLRGGGTLDPRLFDQVVPAEKKPLTPVNGALGEGIGRLLDGKKSAIGIIGALLTQIMPQPVVDVLKTTLPAALVPATSGPLLAIFLAMTAWGALGKVEKIAKGVPSNQ